MVEQIDQQSRYVEGCNALRHYSSCVMNVRTIAIAQGFVILSGTIYLVAQNAFIPSLCLALFGFLFTAVLQSLQKSYWEHFDTILDAVVTLEEHANGNSNSFGPWSTFKQHRSGQYEKPLWRLLVRHGPFAVLLLGLFGISVYDVFKALGR